MKEAAYTFMKSVKLSRGMDKALRREAAYRGTSVSEVMRVLLYDALLANFSLRGESYPSSAPEPLPGQEELPAPVGKEHPLHGLAKGILHQTAREVSFGEGYEGRVLVMGRMGTGEV